MVKTHKILLFFGLFFFFMAIGIGVVERYTNYGLALAGMSATCLMICDVYLQLSKTNERLHEVEEKQKILDHLATLIEKLIEMKSK